MESKDKEGGTPSPEAGDTEEAAVASPEGVETEKAEPESADEALAKLKEQSERYLASWQRVQADFINYKKRVEQERGEHARYAAGGVISSLLQILDDFDRALKSMPPNLMGLTWVDGIFLMQKKLQAILEAHGLSEIKALGENFDPGLHEAVMYGVGEEGKVVEELQRGYKLHDRVIRPSMVQVGKGADTDETKSDTGSDVGSEEEGTEEE